MDASTLAPVEGVLVSVMPDDDVTFTESSGRFQLDSLRCGSVALSISGIGYRSQVLTDIVIKPSRTTEVRIELDPQPIVLGDLEVQGSCFRDRADQPTSLTSFNGEEVRRAPGVGGDISRIMSVLPSVAKVNDQFNSLIVRGGHPIENGFYVDGIPVPNINHYPLMGSTGGPIGLLNVEYVRDVEFSAGGFPARYGNRLSSIVNVRLREGSRTDWNAGFEAGLAGVGIGVEGPAFGSNGSVLVGVRRSFLEWLVDEIGTGVAPVFSDFQGKAVYRIDQENELSVIAIGGFDRLDYSQELAYERGSGTYGTTDGYESAVAVSWLCRWGQKGHSQTSLSTANTRYRYRYRYMSDQRDWLSGNSLESIRLLRHVSSWIVNRKWLMDFGLDWSHLGHHYEYFKANHRDEFGLWVPSLTVNMPYSSDLLGLHATINIHAIPSLVLSLGGRLDYYDHSTAWYFTPRTSATIRVKPWLDLGISAASYVQNVPPLLNTLPHPYYSYLRNLDPPDFIDLKANHFVVGVYLTLGRSCQASVEAYRKNYWNLPMDGYRMRGGLFVLDMVGTEYQSNDIYLPETTGKAISQGIEVTFQKKMIDGLYGVISSAFSTAKYLGLDQKWRPRLCDNQVTFGVEGGYKANDRWEFSARWIYAAGPPYTPIDSLWTAIDRITQRDLTAINQERYPDYHSLNLRVDRRQRLLGVDMVVFLEIWNVYDRKNVLSYDFDFRINQPRAKYQWGRIPMAGIKVEF
ncbi:MAG: TonB-dependent receptor [bacterium]